MQRQRVLKGDSARELGHKVIFDFEDFNQTCSDNIHQAQKQAQQFLDMAHRQIVLKEEQITKEAYQAGYAAGMQSADAEIQRRADSQTVSKLATQLQSILPALEKLSQRLDSAKAEWLAQWQTSVIQLSTAIAERIIRRELASQPELSTSLIREILEAAFPQENIIARVHPHDAKCLESLLQTTREYTSLNRLVTFQPDETLALGDCIIDFTQGSLDARVTTQLQRMMEELVPVEEQPSTHD